MDCEKLLPEVFSVRMDLPLVPEVLNHTAHYDRAGLITSLGAGLGVRVWDATFRTELNFIVRTQGSESAPSPGGSQT